MEVVDLKYIDIRNRIIVHIELTMICDESFQWFNDDGISILHQFLEKKKTSDRSITRLLILK